MAPVRLQASFVLLTYESHVDQQRLLDFVTAIRPGISRYSICHEIGDTGYEHTHAAFDFGGQFKFDSDRFDFDGFHPNIVIKKGQREFKLAVTYTRKAPVGEVLTNCEGFVDKEAAQDAAFEAAIERIQSHNTWGAVVTDLSLRKYTSRMQWMKDVWAARKETIPVDDHSLHDWQQDIVTELEQGTVPKRKVTWVFDAIGNKGKSWLAAHLEHKFPDRVLVLVGGKHLDMAYTYAQCVADIVIFDLPRTYEESVPYALMEQLKNGRVSSQKYQPKMVKRTSVWVYVFANFEPDYSKLSADRWDLRSI